MKYILHKPYFLFLAVTIIFLTIGFVKPEEKLVINIYDIYIVINYLDFAWLLTLIYAFFILIYFFLIKMNYALINWMIVTHVLISIGGLFLIWIFYELTRETNPGDFKNLISDIDFNSKMRWGIIVSVFSIIGTQVIFLVNVIQALLIGKE